MAKLDRVRDLRDATRQMWTSTMFHLQGCGKRVRKKLQQIQERLLAVSAVQLAVRTAKQMGADDASHMAAGVAYYALLSLFPLLLGLIAILGLFLPSETVQEELFDFFRENLPGAVDVLERNITEVIHLRGTLGVLGTIAFFWSGSVMFVAISRVINRAWGIHQDRSFFVKRLRAMAMAFFGVGVLFLLSLSITGAVEVLSSTDSPLLGTAVNVGARLVVFLLNLAVFLLLYKFIPNTKTFWRYVWPGALLAAVLFELAKTLFILYLSNFANYELVYGAVTSVIVLLLWVYFSAFILILGAEFNYEYGRWREEIRQGMDRRN